MRSSPSTRSRRRNGPIRLYLVITGEDHPKACTGRRLVRWRRAIRVAAVPTATPAPVVLDPFAPTPLSSRDRRAAEDGGVLAVDCSWNRLGSRSGFPDDGPRRRGSAVRRRLPILVAANPQHYGRIAQLNTAEALGAALYLLGRPGDAFELLAGLPGGDQFLPINRERLDRYREAAGPEEVESAERRLFGGA